MAKYLFYLCGDASKASSRVRGYWLVDELEQVGEKCSVESKHSKLALILFSLRILFSDIVIFQKCYGRWHVLLEWWARKLGRITVVDIDDMPSRTNNAVTLGHLREIMTRASAVTVGSVALKDYAEQYSGNVCLIPSCIRLPYYKRRINDNSMERTVCFGWIGNGEHYQLDLIKILKRPITELAKRHPTRLKLIGVCGVPALYNAFEKISGLDVEFIDSIDWKNPSAVSDALNGIDIGLYPLLGNEFNKYKCGFKALEYMAMMIPVISSGVGENNFIVVDSVNGLIANSESEWFNSLSLLSNDLVLRKKMGCLGRVMVEEKFSTTIAANKLRSLVLGISNDN